MQHTPTARFIMQFNNNDLNWQLFLLFLIAALMFLKIAILLNYPVITKFISKLFFSVPFNGKH